MRWGILSPRSDFFKRKMCYAFEKRDFLCISREPGIVHLPYGKCNIYSLTDIVEKIDAVYICTPPSTHYSLAKHFLGNKKHVLCEKPLTLVSKEIDDLLRTAKSNKVKLGMTFQPFFKNWNMIVTAINNAKTLINGKSMFTFPHTGIIEDVVSEVGFYPAMAATAFAGSDIDSYIFYQDNDIHYADIYFANKNKWVIGCSINSDFQQYIQLDIENQQKVFEKPFTDIAKSKIYEKVVEDFENDNLGLNSILLLKRCCNFLNDWSKHVKQGKKL